MRFLVAFLLLTGCATTKQYSPQLHRELPSQMVGQFVRTDCDDFPETGAVACTYIGWVGEHLCATIVVAVSGEPPNYETMWSTCNITKVWITTPDLGSEGKTPDPENSL